MSEARARGSCLCGAVRYEVHGPLRDVIVCHCRECRRWHGHACSASASAKDDLVIRDNEGALRWIDSPKSDAHGRRGFCSRCGSSLFWDAPGRPTTAIAAGTLDEPTGLRTISHIYTATKGDYYELPDDGLPRFAYSGNETPDAAH
jgi:hypothetical protein